MFGLKPSLKITEKHLWNSNMRKHVPVDCQWIFQASMFDITISLLCISGSPGSSQWRHNERNSISNHQPHDCLFNCLFKVQIKENLKSYVSLAFEQGIHRWPMNSLHKGPVTQKMFPFDDVIMGTSFCDMLRLTAAGLHHNIRLCQDMVYNIVHIELYFYHPHQQMGFQLLDSSNVLYVL